MDNDIHTCEWIRHVLAIRGIDCRLKTIGTGRAAFEEMVRNDYDLLIVEYALPDMTGVQLCSLLREISIETPVLFFTAMNRPIDRQKATEAGADEYLSKPDDLDIFTEAVGDLLQAHPRNHALTHSRPTLARAA
ncbi:MAG: response regulator transcription factor [Pyrinomonadaceae bacterium]